MQPLQQISDSELALMRIIWEAGGQALFAEIMEKLEEKGLAWKKNTVLTFLSRLVEKGLLRTSKIGRRNEYAALVSEEQYLADQTRCFLERVYEGNVRGLVTTLLEQDMIPAEDADELEDYWRKAGEKG